MTSTSSTTTTSSADTRASTHRIKLFTAELDRHVRRRSTWLTALVAFALLLFQAREPDDFTEVIELGGVFLMLWALVSAAANVGQDISSGSLGTWLTFHPRRMQVWWTRLLAIAVTTLVVSGVPLILMWFVASITSGSEGLPDGTGVFLGLALLVMVAASILGAALAAIFGSTLASIGATLGYLAMMFVTTIVFDDGEGWGPGLHMVNLLSASDSLAYPCATDGGGCTTTNSLYLQGSSADVIGLLIWTGLLVAVASFCWRRRDVD